MGYKREPIRHARRMTTGSTRGEMTGYIVWFSALAHAIAGLLMAIRGSAEFQILYWAGISIWLPGSLIMLISGALLDLRTLPWWQNTMWVAAFGWCMLAGLGVITIPW